MTLKLVHLLKTLVVKNTTQKSQHMKQNKIQLLPIYTHINFVNVHIRVQQRNCEKNGSIKYVSIQNNNA